MDYKTGEIVETKDITFAENVPNLRGIVHMMPGLNGDHWFASDQLQDSDSATVPTDDPDSSLDIVTTSLIPDVSTRPVDDTIIITQDNIDDFLDEPLQLQSKRTRTQVDKFTYPTT